jgi:predicted transcriptional regulator
MPKHHTDEEYLEAIEAGNRTTTEIANTVDVARQSAYERLHSLREKGAVEKEKIGNSLLWRLSE